VGVLAALAAGGIYWHTRNATLHKPRSGSTQLHDWSDRLLFILLLNAAIGLWSEAVFRDDNNIVEYAVSFITT
jgi:hypothetical protein